MLHKQDASPWEKDMMLKKHQWVVFRSAEAPICCSVIKKAVPTSGVDEVVAGKGNMVCAPVLYPLS